MGRVDILIKGSQGKGKSKLHQRLFEILGKEEDLEVIKKEEVEGQPPMLHVIWKKDV